MFDFLFKTKPGDAGESYFDIINADLKKCALSKIAINKAVEIIAKAVAKSDIKIYDANGNSICNELTYLLNIRPNDNESGFYFWEKAVKRLLIYRECLIVRVGEKIYVATEYEINDSVLSAKKVTNVYISDDKGRTLKLNKNFKMTDVIYLKMPYDESKKYIDSVLNLYDETLTAICSGVKNKNMPKYKINAETDLRLATKNPDGSVTELTKDQYANKVNEFLNSDTLSVMMFGRGLDVEAIKNEGGGNASEISAMAKEIFTACAMAFDIPQAVFFGTITEKSDASNELITYAVSPIVALIEDGLNEAFVGCANYIQGEKIQVDLSRFKHLDIIDCASSLDKLRSIGFTFDEILGLFGIPPQNTKFSTTRALTKNYSEEGVKEDGE